MAAGLTDAIDGDGSRSPGRRSQKVGPGRHDLVIIIIHRGVGDRPLTPREPRRLFTCCNASPPPLRRRRRRHPFVNRIRSVDPKGAAHSIEAFVPFPLLEDEERFVLLLLLFFFGIDFLVLLVFELGFGVKAGIGIGIDGCVVVCSPV